MYSAGTVDQGTFKTLVYGLTALLSAWKLELETSIEARLSALEDFAREIHR